MENEILKATHTGELHIGDISIACYILEDGTRILSNRGMLKALGMSPGTSGEKGDDRFASFASGNRIKPFVDAESLAMIKSPKKFMFANKYLLGYDARVLQKVVRGVSKAYLQKKLQKQQEHIGARAEQLDDAFSQIGLIALIDEATGYQYDREQRELQAVLKTLIGNKIEGWERQFELSFYKEIYKLWDIPFTPQNIKHKPQFIGHITNKYIYNNLPKGEHVLKELKSKTPKNEKGNYKNKLHQWLTKAEGRDALKKVLTTVEGFASISDTKAEFDRLIQKKYGQQALSFPDFDPYLDEKPKDEKKELPPLSDFNDKLKKGLNFDPNANKE